MSRPAAEAAQTEQPQPLQTRKSAHQREGNVRTPADLGQDQIVGRRLCARSGRWLPTLKRTFRDEALLQRLSSAPQFVHQGSDACQFVLEAYAAPVQAANGDYGPGACFTFLS